MSNLRHAFLQQQAIQGFSSKVPAAKHFDGMAPCRRPGPNILMAWHHVEAKGCESDCQAVQSWAALHP